MLLLFYSGIMHSYFSQRDIKLPFVCEHHIKKNGKQVSHSLLYTF